MGSNKGRPPCCSAAGPRFPRCPTIPPTFQAHQRCHAMPCGIVSSAMSRLRNLARWAASCGISHAAVDTGRTGPRCPARVPQVPDRTDETPGASAMPRDTWWYCEQCHESFAQFGPVGGELWNFSCNTRFPVECMHLGAHLCVPRGIGAAVDAHFGA